MSVFLQVACTSVGRFWEPVTMLESGSVRSRSNQSSPPPPSSPSLSIIPPTADDGPDADDLALSHVAHFSLADGLTNRRPRLLQPEHCSATPISTDPYVSAAGYRLQVTVCRLPRVTLAVITSADRHPRALAVSRADPPHDGLGADLFPNHTPVLPTR